ncbi:TIGR02679 family protein [Nocardia sp. NPDC052112]|uniref:TIGR02679 family protein n=1 Tax=Nocardia sp. NPDC052112 TaxID=3155646 RepID=UPI003426612F
MTAERLSPDLAPVWAVLHRRLSTGQAVHRIKVGPLDPNQQAAIADLFGSPRLPGLYWTGSLADIDAVLLEVTGCDARAVVEQLIGPVGNRSAERAADAAARHELWRWLSEHNVVRAQPALATWVSAVQRNGLIAKSVERTRSELERTLRVLHELPCPGTPLPVFAAELLGDPHELDEGTRVQAMVVRALTAIYGTEPPADAVGLRALWARAGIADDELSSTVLVAGLPMYDTGTPIGHILHSCASAGLASVLTLQQLRVQSESIKVADRVWVVENPSVLAMALTRFGTGCPPMVCTSGWPSSAGVLLLEQLAQAGTELYYHGDFDGEGLRIAANLVARVDVVPWRMTSADYLRAVGADGPEVGRVTPVPWDLELSEHMRRTGRAVPEERVVEDLLADIGG